MKTLESYTEEKASWITVVDGEYYPDDLEAAIPQYESIMLTFGSLLASSVSSAELLRAITERAGGAKGDRIQLLRIFRRYVSPDTSVEMLKVKSKIPQIIDNFGYRFRDIEVVQRQFTERPTPDEALIALLHEHDRRGQKGYSTSKLFFDWFAENLRDNFSIFGPVGAGRDINLREHFENYPGDRPVDFLISERTGTLRPLVVGLIRYDSDRGGAQEDDRTGGYRNVVKEVLDYNKSLKLLFVNDGPGLLLGSMWKDYCEIEKSGQGRVMVATLKMLPERLTIEWIRS